MNPLIPLLLAVLVLFTTGCIQPPASVTENETGFNLSTVERDPVREAAAQAAYFPNASELDEFYLKDPEIAGYYQYMNETEHATYFDYLVHTYPQTYQYYQNISPDMSFLYFLERYDTYYPYTLNHNSKYVPYRLGQVYDEYRDHNNTVITLTEKMIQENPILSSYFVTVPRYPLKVLPEEEYLLDPFRYAYLKWNGTLYQQIRSIA